MKRRGFIVTIVLVLMVLCVSVQSQADEDLVQNVVDGCKTELTTYCKDVTPGEGRALACLYAHGDKLSGRCEYALYDAAAQLERFVAALSYVVNECKGDLVDLCGGVVTGEGRLLECLEKNDSKVSDRCKQAMKDVQVTRVK
jgi:Cysteine rich repeat